MIETEWTLLPGFTVGTLIAIAGVAGTFAVMKSRTDDIPAWRKEVSEKLEKMEEKQETRDEKIHGRLDGLRDSMTAMSIQVALIQETNESTRQRDRRARDRE